MNGTDVSDTVQENQGGALLGISEDEIAPARAEWKAGSPQAVSW